MSDDVQPSPVENPCEQGNSREVGYKRPPVRTRFKKGQSGNPSGKNNGSFLTRIRKMIEEEGGEKAVKAFVSQMNRGSFKHAQEIINREEGKVPDKTIHSGEVIAKAYVTISPSDWDALSKPKPADAEHQADSGV
jgi:hypothetical protein